MHIPIRQTSRPVRALWTISIWPFIVAGLAGSVFGQFEGGAVGLYSESNCSVPYYTDEGVSVFSVYVCHSNMEINYASAIEFKVEASPGFSGTWLSDFSPFLLGGNSQTGITISYGACLSDPGLILTIQYMVVGTSECSELRVVPHPHDSLGRIAVLPCAGMVVSAQGGELTVNCPVPVTPSTWGRIKEMFRD